MSILETENVEKHFRRDRSVLDLLMRRHNDPVQAVDGVSLSIGENQVQGIIGESGCGKTTLMKLLLGLDDPTGGTIRFRGEDVSEYDRHEWKAFRRNVQVILQDPFNSLDPKMTVEKSLKMTLDVHDMGNQDERIHSTLESVELGPPERYLDSFPDQLSGGEKQRVSIARALILEPEVILADEPVSMLDVSTQAVILNLLSELIEEKDLSMMYISHDLSTVSYVCDWINVMYLGRIVETAPTRQLLADPKHPYTEELLKAVPHLNPHDDRKRTELVGSTPDPIGIGEGCRFRDRCLERMDICEVTPESVSVGEDRYVACHLHYDHEAVGSDGVPTDGTAASVGRADGEPEEVDQQ